LLARMHCHFVGIAIAVLLGLSCATAETNGERPNSPSDDDASVTDDGGAAGATSVGTGGTTILQPGDEASLNEAAAVPGLHVWPENAVLEVTITDGVLSATAVTDGGTGSSVTFTATLDGAPAIGSFSIDRGEIGSIDPGTGAFTPTGAVGGVVRVTVETKDAKAATDLTVQIHRIQNGGPPGQPDAGPITEPDAGADAGDAGPSSGVGKGGVGGVGGEGLGPKIDDALRTRLLGPVTSASKFELQMLYPYDKTVWPRGLLAPLLQWSTTFDLTAVYIHLKEAGFEFEGFYGKIGGYPLIHHPIDQDVWKAALASNRGEPLQLEIKLADATNVYGPLTERWTIAPGTLKGTVYYNSYGTSLASKLPDQDFAGGVLAIKPGSPDPTLAIPGNRDKCVVCHSVSDDGSTLYAADTTINASGPYAPFDYNNNFSYDLRSAGTVIRGYSGTASDGTPNIRKFLWSAPYTDGTFSLLGGSERWGNATGDLGMNGWNDVPTMTSRLFRRDNGNMIDAAGLSGITLAVTPAFSKDGKKVAFNYWTGTAGPGGGKGQTLDMMDFECGPKIDDAGTSADAGTSDDAGASGAPPSCGSFTFSNLKRIYTSGASRFAGLPAWLPDGSGIVFHDMISREGGWRGPFIACCNSLADLWFVMLPKPGVPFAVAVALQSLNGTGYLPQIWGDSSHDFDNEMNYEPTVASVASGGYFWVVFTSQRMYGNVLHGPPFVWGGPQKKLWVAAIDMNAEPGVDPSHPAFYLPGQELGAGNMRGFWVVDPCRTDGASCDTGDECCNGFCRAATPGGPLACGPKPPGCAYEFEACTVSTDCCGYLTTGDGFNCVNGRCAQPPPPRIQ
jgi:hypothetical protein